MKKLFPVLFIALLAKAFAAYAETELTKEQRMIGTMIDQYATVSGAWYLDNKCDITSEELRKEWEANIASCTVRLQRNIGASTEMLHKIQDAGKSAAADRACNDETRDIVVHAVLMAKKLSEALTILDKDSNTKKDLQNYLHAREKEYDNGNAK